MEKKTNSLTKSGIYYLIYNVLNLAFPLVNGIYVSRILLPQSIGVVTAAYNVAQYFVIFSFLGIPTYGLREISKVRNDKVERSKVFSELYIINLVSTIVFLTIFISLIFLVPTYRKDIVIYLISGIAIALNAFNISWLYEGLEEFRFISIRNLVFKAFAFVMLVVLVRHQTDIVEYAFIAVIGVAGNYVVNMICAPRYVKFSLKELNFKRHMKSIMYLVAVNLAIELYSLIDVTMMNFWCDKDSIAYYKYGHQIEKMLAQIVNTFTIVLIPRISLYYKEKKMDQFNHLISKALKLIILFSIPMMVGIFFTADFLMVKMYGDLYIRSAIILKVFSVLLLISPIGYLLGSRVLLVTGHEKLMIISVGIGAIVNVFGNLYLIPRYNEFGATVASVISEVVVMVVYIFMGKKHFKLNRISPTVLKVIVSSGIMGVYLFFCSHTHINPWIMLITQIFGSIAIYFVLLNILKEQVVVEYTNILVGKLNVIRHRNIK